MLIIITMDSQLIWLPVILRRWTYYIVMSLVQCSK